jgi:transposase
LDEGTIANYRKRYKEGGLDDLVDDSYKYNATKLCDDKLIELQQHLINTTYQKTQEICDYVKKKYGASYSCSGMGSLLHRLGFSYKKAKGVPGKANKLDQEKFIDNYKNIKSSNDKVYFVDSTHPQHNPVLSYGWIKTGEELEIKTNNGRKHLNITGAIEINSREVIARSSERINSNSICDLMKAIRVKNPLDVTVALVMDNAAYNKSRIVVSLAKELKINLHYLPPYSPNRATLEIYEEKDSL